MKSSLNKNQFEKLIPVLSDKEKQEMVAYYTVYEKYAEEFSKKATEDLQDHPVFGKLIRGIPKEVAAANDKLSKALQKDAIINENWGAYIEYQIAQGIAYAKMGLDFKSWYEVIALVRNYLTPYLHLEYGSGASLLSALSGMNRFMDIAMGIIGEAYMQEKEEIILEEREKIKKLNKELEQKVTERTGELRKSNELFILLFEHNPASIAISRLDDGKIINVNSTFLETTGFSSKEEVIGKTAVELGIYARPEQREEIALLIKANKEVNDFKIKSLTKNGEVEWLSSSFKLLEIDNTAYLLSVSIDITRREKAEKELEILLEQLKEAQALSHIGNWYRPFNGINKKASWSDEIYRILGLDKNETVPTQEMFLAAIHPEDLAYVQEKMQEVHQTKEGCTFNFRIKKKNGAVIYAVSQVHCDFDEDGKVVGFFGILQDITESKIAEKELLAINEELKSFSYSISHDLRAPIRAINGFAKMLQEDYASNLDGDGMDFLKTIQHNSKKMGQLIDALLAFSKLGKTKITSSEINMTALVKSVEKEERIGNTNEIEFVMQELPSAKGSHALVRQVWANLISNAIKYSKHQPKTRIEIGSYYEDELVVYYVKDNGAGFDMLYYDKLFGVFQRLHSQEEFAGIGIGLSMVQKIVHRHGGSVWAESKLNEGSCFYFSLPTTNL